MGYLFEHSFIDTSLPVDEGGRGQYGQTGVADLDGDGRPEFLCGRWREGRVWWFDWLGPGEWVRREVGRDSLSPVGLTTLDVDADGWPDVIGSGAWFRNSGDPVERGFERFVFDPDGGGAHDILPADIDSDGHPEIVTLGDKSGIHWYKIPPDPTGPWRRHEITPTAYHGTLCPRGIGDLNGDGAVDLVHGDTWFENVNGDGSVWVAHRNIPFGRVGPYGLCTRTILVDIDGDGQDELVVSDADIVDSRLVILKNTDGRGGAWAVIELPHSFTCGSLHALAVADFNGNGRLDIVAAEQEELLPPGRTNPRFILWENCGGLEFREHIILDRQLGGHEFQLGDFDGDGRIDIVSKPWDASSWNGAGGRMHVDFLRNLSTP